jgi:hypothetical protein
MSKKRETFLKEQFFILDKHNVVHHSIDINIKYDEKEKK